VTTPRPREEMASTPGNKRVATIRFIG
jgi:hypothetical protein